MICRVLRDIVTLLKDSTLHCNEYLGALVKIEEIERKQRKNVGVVRYIHCRNLSIHFIPIGTINILIARVFASHFLLQNILFVPTLFDDQSHKICSYCNKKAEIYTVFQNLFHTLFFPPSLLVRVITNCATHPVMINTTAVDSTLIIR